jgi:hypothetical protein
MSKRLTALLPLLLIAGCGDTAGEDAAAPKAALSRTDAALPSGFTLYTGGRDIIGFSASEPETGGTVVTWSMIAEPGDVIRHYEAEALTAGLTYAGRLNGGEILSYEARRTGEGEPRTFSATVLKKGEYTNVTLNFDVTA